VIPGGGVEVRRTAYCVDAFSQRFHHPKEDRYLCELLRIRCPAGMPPRGTAATGRCCGVP
jgi:hypothetical protein